MDTDSIVKRWQDLGNLLLGIWLFISPWVIQYPADMPAAASNAHILGAMIIVFAGVAIYIPKLWEEWINIVLGIWLIVSPWVIGFASYRDITIHTVVVGVLVTALAAWAMLRDKNFTKWQHDRHASS